MLYREIITVCSEIQTKRINTAVWAERRVLDAFAKLRKATIGIVMYVCMSVCPSVRPSVRPSILVELGCHWADFHEIWYLSTFQSSVEEVQLSLKSDRNKERFTWRSTHTFYRISLRPS